MAHRARVRFDTRARSLAIALVLAAILLYFAFRGVDWTELWSTLSRARLEYLLLTMAAYTLSLTLRSLRWRLLLGAQEWLPVLTTFWATGIGYMGNLVLPARAGELMRTAMIARHSSLGIGYVVATAVTERVLDAIALVLILSSILATLPQAPEWLAVAARASALVGLLGLGVLLALPAFEGLALGLVDRIPVSPGLREKIGALLSRFLLGLRAIRDPRRAGAFVAFTGLIWLVDGLAGVACARALGLDLSLSAALLLLSALGLASAAPSTPGFVGIYQFVAATVLPIFGMTQAESLAYILALQGVVYVMMLPWGLLGLWRLGGRPAATREC